MALKPTIPMDCVLHGAGIPPDAHDYQVNGRTPLEWFIDCYRLTRQAQRDR